MTDIVGSTEHASELGDSAWHELVQTHNAVIRAALRRHGGREIDTAGDGFFAVFDAPAAAVRCALEIATRVRELGVEIRAGIHVGEVEQAGPKVAGITVPIAARIMSGASASEVLVSSTVRDLTAGSRFAFEDRGIRELKGVPGEWHVYAVTAGTTDAGEAAEPSSARERRAAAVRRAQSRPVWRRRPRLVAAAVVGLAIVLATSALLVWKPWQPPALAGVEENSIGIIDPARGELIGQIGVGTQPSGIAVAEGYAWVTNTADDSVSQIDLTTRSVSRIPVGEGPTAIAANGGSIWVANTGGRTVSRINAATGRVVQEPEVGNAPSAIVAAADALWVANATDSTIVRIDAATGVPGAPVGVAANPVALAADSTAVWVASEDLASVARLDPTSASTIALVPLGIRPSALALGSDGLWVASSDGSLTRIDRDTNRVLATVPVPGSLASILLTDAYVWLGDRTGAVFRVDRADPLQPARRVPTTTSVAALAAVEPHGVWLATQQSPESHRGGVLRAFMPATFGNPTDPLGDLVVSGMPIGDGLVGLRRAGGAAGSTLLPNLATSIPVPTDGGLTYTFSLRPEIVYSTGEPLRPTDFRRAIERSFLVASSFYGVTWGTVLFASISGTDACQPTRDEVGNLIAAAASCDLSSGILTDDAARTVTFKLARPDPDFVYKLATVVAYPVPESVSMSALVDGAFPVTGPYAVASVSDSEIRLRRNEHFSVWDAAVRPDGFPDEIVLTVMNCPEADCPPDVSDAAIAAVENGNADVVPLALPVHASEDLLARLSVQYPERWHYGSARTLSVVMNTKLPPFDNVDVRKAVNLALDRRLLGASAAPTCQLLPPGWPGYQPYCPYTTSSDAGGRWHGPDLERARQLVRASGTAGMEVTVGPTPPPFVDRLDYLASMLTDLGYEVTAVDRNTDFEHVFAGAPSMHVTINGWIADYLAPGNFLQLFLCPEAGEPDADGIILYCDETGEFNAAFERAIELQTTDRAAANAAWAELDRWATDQAILAPIANSGANFVSERVGNYQFNPSGFPLYDQMWVQ